MTNSPVFPTPKTWKEHYDTHVNNPWVSQNRFITNRQFQNAIPAFSEARSILPEPFWAGHPGTIDCYWRAWELAFSNLKQPTLENDFSTRLLRYCLQWQSVHVGFGFHHVLWIVRTASFQFPRGLWILFIGNNTRMGSSAGKYPKRTGRIHFTASIPPALVPMSSLGLNGTTF